MRRFAGVLAAALIVIPPGARAADLVVWRDEGWYPEEAEAAAEVVKAFEQDTGKQVELAFYLQAELPGEIEAALELGEARFRLRPQPPR